MSFKGNLMRGHLGRDDKDQVQWEGQELKYMRRKNTVKAESQAIQDTIITEILNK